MKQSEKIIFRVRKDMKLFVKEFAEKMGMDTSELMRLILEYYFLAQYLEQGSYRQIRQKFFDMYPEREKKRKKGK